MKGFEKLDIRFDIFKKHVKWNSRDIGILMSCPSSKGLDDTYDCTNGFAGYCGKCWHTALEKDYQ